MHCKHVQHICYSAAEHVTAAQVAERLTTQRTSVDDSSDQLVEVKWHDVLK